MSNLIYEQLCYKYSNNFVHDIVKNIYTSF